MTTDGARAWWLVSLLCLSSLLSIIDRKILSLVVDPVRADLLLSDVQIGLLQGLAFGLVYAFAGVFLGTMADRYNRRNLIIFGVVVWSMATAAAGIAQNFGQLFLARVIVGFGEAALAPAAVSLIADMFPPERRGRPMGLYMTGQAIANGVAISLTGVVLAAAAAQKFSWLGIPDTLSPWRVTFVLCGASGIVLVLGLLTCREAPRSSEAIAPSWLAQGRETLSHLIDHRRFFAPLYLGFAACFLAAYGGASWTPTMLGRVFDFSPADLAKTLGPMVISFAVIGPLIGSAVIDPMVKRYGDAGRLLLVAAVTLLAVPSALAAFAPGGNSSAFLVASSSAIFPFVGLGVITALQSAWPARMRGLGVALTGLFNTIIGAVFGPLLIAMLTERVFRDPDMVGISIALVIVPALIFAAIMFVLAARAVNPASNSDALPT
ncbi:MAG: MFS transporter [Lysobacterales bacterium]